MKAMIFAAGLGTRLKPLTISRPKALIPVHGKPMLEWVILKLKKNNIEDIIINVHHYPGQVIDFLKSKDNFNINIEISHEHDLLDTGGGLKKAGWFFENEKDILIHNTDILSDIDLSAMYQQHTRNNADATLCVSQRPSSRYLLSDSSGYLCGWQSIKTAETLWVEKPVKNVRQFAFNGIHIISEKFIKKFKAESNYPIIPEYLRLAKDHKICFYDASQSRWLDLGKNKNLKRADKLFNDKYFSELTIYD
jgi:N-acetyl-alpha-D-muramate 1-phosphate uridylyltransferase